QPLAVTGAEQPTYSRRYAERREVVIRDDRADDRLGTFIVIDVKAHRHRRESIRIDVRDRRRARADVQVILVRDRIDAEPAVRADDVDEAVWFGHTAWRPQQQTVRGGEDCGYSA